MHRVPELMSAADAGKVYCVFQVSQSGSELGADALKGDRVPRVLLDGRLSRR